MRTASLAAIVLACGAACSRADRPRSDATPARGAAGPAQEKRAGTASAGSAAAVVLDMVNGFDGCTLGHRGVLLDLGDATTRARLSNGRLAAPDVATREHQGATWAVLHERSLALSFVSPAEIRPESGVVVEARVRGGTAKSLSVYLGGKPVGSLPLTRGEVTVVSAHASTAGIARGTNELMLRVVGGPRATRDQLAEIDWIRVGPYDGDAAYAAPTRSDALTTVTLGGVPRRGLSLRAPGFARCAGFIPDGAVLEGFVGVAGGGEAEAEVRVLVDRAEPRVVGTLQLGAPGEPGAWRPISLPLGEAGTVAGVELVAKSSVKGARIVFAEPRVVAAPPKEEVSVPTSRGVLLVVLGSTPRRELSPYGGALATAGLAQLAASGLVFESHRASTSLASGALASMLTGLSPRRHGVVDPDAELASAVPALAETCRQAGVVTGMFTANPTTSAPFGFARGWETFEARSPVDDEPATAVFELAARWLEAHKGDRFLAVVHARGGHPPWDVTNDELKDMPPSGYAGSLDPRHAGEMLGKARRPGAGRLTDADRVRAVALHGRAVVAHDAAVGKLLAHLRALGREGDTTVIVTGDVGVDGGAPVPYLEDGALDEASLALPLIVSAPGVPATRVSAPTSSVDLARTMLEALGLPAPPQLEGESLWSPRLRARVAERPAVASAGARFSARWGGFVLAGVRERDAKLCNLSLEPDCVGDVRATHPLAAEVMQALVHDELAAARTATDGRNARSPGDGRVLVTDPAALSALRAWGR